MSVQAAYLGIILIWSTTPLAIQWSTQGTGFALAVFARMAIGVVVAALLVLVWRIRFPLHARARRAYLVGGLGLFGAMALTYWGARYVHSGLISVLFGLSPLMAAVLAFEVSGDYAVVLPLAVATAVAAAVSRGMNGESIYTAELKEKGLEWDVTLEGGRSVRRVE